MSNPPDIPDILIITSLDTGEGKYPAQVRKLMAALADLVEVSGGNLPGAAGKVDVVRVVHFAQVIEAASLRTPPFQSFSCHRPTFMI